MKRLGIGQKQPILALVGDGGAGKSRLAYKASLVEASPVQLVVWRTTRALPSASDRRRFSKLSAEELARRRDRGEILFECETPRGTYALLRGDVVEATQTRVGLLTGPSAAAKAVRAAGLWTYVVCVRAQAGAADIDNTLGSTPDSLRDDPRASGLLLDDYYDNDFGPGGLARGVEFVLMRARQLAIVS